MQCEQTGSPANPKSSYQIVIEGTGILPTPSSCVLTENFKLLPNSLRKTTVNLTKAPIILPNVENTLHFSEEYLLQTEIRHSTELQHLDDVVERPTSRSSTQGLDMSKPVTVLQSRELYSPLSPVVWILGIVVTRTELGIIRIIWFVSPGTNYTCIRQPNRSQAVTGKEINESNIGFQLESKRQKESSVDAPGELTGSQLQPAVFVRNGWLQADCP